MSPKTKIAVGVAAALGVGALTLIVLSHRSAQAARDQTASSDSAFPSILFTTGGQPNAIAPAGGSAMQDNGSTAAPDTTSAAIDAALAGVEAQTQGNLLSGYDTNSTGLFAGLAQALAAAGLTNYDVSQTRDADGNTSLSSSIVYRPADAPLAYSKTVSFGNNTSTRVAANEQAAYSLAAADVLLADFGIAVPTTAAESLKSQYGITGDLSANLRAVNPQARLV